MTDKIPLLEKLRTETADAHEALHVHPLLAPLHDGEISRAHYRDVLRAFHGAYRIMEARRLFSAQQFPETAALSLLQQDMTRHGVAAAGIEVDYPAVDTIGKLVGYLYVKEGSTLGGQVISRHLKRELGLKPGDDNRFFAGRGKGTAAHWRQFLARLEDVTGGVNHQEATVQALASFRLIATVCDRVSDQAEAA